MCLRQRFHALAANVETNSVQTLCTSTFDAENTALQCCIVYLTQLHRRSMVTVAHAAATRSINFLTRSRVNYDRPIGQAIIFGRCGFFFLSFFLSFFISFFLSFFLSSSSSSSFLAFLSGRRLDVYHTFHTRCGHRPSANLECRSEMCCMWLAEIQDA